MASAGHSTETTCLYRVLGVERNAEHDAIRSAYKKLVLKWHPDRNLDNPHDAEIRFKQIQTAFEILSNENERAWYDANQERILNGISSTGDDAFQDPCGVDLYQYFSLSCFDGFSNDATGFYFVFSSAFESIGEAEEVSVPNFGDSSFAWSRVRKFYSFWDNFGTRRKFRWAAKHNLNDAVNRRERGLMKKANSKSMEECRREWEGNVRRLVNFVKNLDPRVRHRVLQEADEQREMDADSRLHRQEISDVMEARRGRDLQREVDKLDQMMEEHGRDLSESASTQLVCLICRRKFRSEKTLMTHKSSAKHIQRAKRLETHLKREEKLVFGMTPQEDAEEDVDDDYEPVPASRAPPPPGGVVDVLDGMDDDASSVAAASVVSGFSDFVLVEELDDADEDDDEDDDDDDEDDEDVYSEEDDDGVHVDFWENTITVDSDQELDIVGVGLLDTLVTRATEDATATTEQSGVPDVSLDLLLAQQLATGLSVAADDAVDEPLLAQLMDSSNLDRLLALQLEEEDLMARRALAVGADRDTDAIYSDAEDYDSELDTLVDALSAKMISMDDPTLNVKDLEKRLQHAIARSGSSQSRRSQKKNKKRRRKRRMHVVQGLNNDEAGEGVDEFLSRFRKGKEVTKTKKEMRGDKKRRRRRRLANDPQSTSRCAVCHRGFASKTKLNRHVEANPSHVVKA